MVGAVESTREQVLRYVRGHRETTVARLAEALGLTVQAVRRHLDSLRADGLVAVRQERHGIGRPALVFTITEKGEEMASRGYVQLMSRLVRHLEKLDAVPTGGRILEQVFAGIAQEVAAEHEAEVRSPRLDERVAEVSRALAEEGIVDGWKKIGEGVYQLMNGECPYLRVAEMSSAACLSDRRSIELLVGAPVEQTSRIVDGALRCEYLVRAQQVTLDAEARKETE